MRYLQQRRILSVLPLTGMYSERPALRAAKTALFRIILIALSWHDTNVAHIVFECTSRGFPSGGFTRMFLGEIGRSRL